MNIKQKVLKFLIENRGKSFSINGISKVLKIDYKLVYSNIKKLQEEKTINVEDLGNIKRCSFVDYFNDDVFIVENERKKEFLKNKDLLVISNRLNKINKQFILLLFGSYVKENATKHSDLDFLLICSEQDSGIIESELGLIPLKIHLTALNYEQFDEMLKSKEFSVVSEAVKKNVILYGLEDYYRLLKNAR